MKTHSIWSGPWWQQIRSESMDRGRWLVVLLGLQSISSFVLSSYEELVKQHMVVTLFLTMLVGAGGNCGVQSAVKVIRGMALGEVRLLSAALAEQAMVGLLLGTVISTAAWLRVWGFGMGVRNAHAIALSCWAIVVMSVIAGTSLPFALRLVGLDPGHAGAAVQVIMDVMGCLITCAICSVVLAAASSVSQPGDLLHVPDTLDDVSDTCLLYTSDAADEEDSVDLGGRRIIKKKNKKADKIRRHENKQLGCRQC
eukprot:TRINITY_DN23449_c0_g1_i2.p1 TRINITY_DN23449_c0_g1~~TRINITY_DN23449_c0_g1_i2.p1  ORF type:complete len:254 (+),score=54.53 TRINITY_DN23449_c0_g1_i2:222-983(+)